MKQKTLIILNKTFEHGFGVAPFIILRNPLIPNQLKPLYLLLLSYAWYNAQCFPGQDRLASNLGITDEGVRNQLKELRRLGLIEWKVRGQGKTNIYYILDIPQDLIPNNFEAEPNSSWVLEPNSSITPTIEVDEDVNKLSNIKNTIGKDREKDTGNNPLKELLSKRHSKKEKSKIGYYKPAPPRETFKKAKRTAANGRGVV